MSRAIDADALIAQMKADAEQMEDPIAKMFTYAAINDVKHAPTIEPEQKWIPVSKELPKTSVLVWVTDLHQHVSACQLYTNISDWYSESDEWMYKHDSIIAWKPYIVPEPYNGGEPG